MARLEGRVRRLEARLKGEHASIWHARLARMSEEEVRGELAKLAMDHGMPEVLAGDVAGIITWAEEFIARIQAQIEAEPPEMI